MMGALLQGQTPIAVYYAGISTSNSTFVNDLKTRIRSPYTKISYDQFDETNISNYAAQPNGSGGNYVTCVYTGYQYNYTGTFTWGVMSREHTWCHSWMPTYNSTSGEEYSDQHHLFPTHQNNANGRRSNHPLGVVTTVSYQYLDGKLGTNSLGQTVYEPRDQQKGDAARALFYMALRYDDVNGNNWDFNWLNNVRLPSLSEAPEDLDLLLQWHQNDPPDAWEIARNDYIESIQKNRNPFIDHPEYTTYINFSDMSYAGAVSLSAEPTNYVTDLTASNTASSSIQINWTDALAGAQVPGGYLIVVSTNSTITNPVDGTVYADDLDLSDGVGKLYVEYSAADSSLFSNLSSSTIYYFHVFSYNGAGSSINYKTDGTIPTVNETTLTGSGTSALSAGDIVIIGFNMDDPDEIAFVPLVDLAGGVVINFTDNGWLSTGSLRSGEGTIVWTAPLGGVNHGAIIDVTATTASIGSVSVTGSFGFSASGDQIIAYTGTASSPNFIYAVNDDSTDWNQTASSTNTSALPAGLIDGISAVALNEIDNAIYTGTVSSDKAQLRLDVGTKTNWIGSDTARQTMPSGAWALPVELTSFTATVQNKSVKLLWQTATEVNNYGFQIERSQKSVVNSQNVEWNKVGFVNGAGNSNSTKEYSFVDVSAASGKYSYRLKQMDNDGKYTYSKEVEVELAAPTTFALEQNYPNPFNPETSIQYSVVDNQFVSLKVYDVLGNEVAVLVNEMQSAGNYHVTFNPQLTTNHLQPTSGVYFYTLRAGEFVQTKKMIVLK